MLTNLKLYFLLGAIVMAFTAGFYTEYRFSQAALQKQTEARLKDVSKGTTKIIDFNGKVDNALGKNDCADKPVPVAMLKLLR